MTIPPKPTRIDHDTPPPGVDLRLLSFAGKRPRIKCRLVLFHTNGAAREGSVQSSINWAEANPGVNTAPHFQVDRQDEAAMLLPLDVKGIGNYQAATFSWVVETADTGYLDDPTVSAFTPYQLEVCATIAAYAHVLDGVPLSTPTSWDGSGIASHTDPFGYPHWTNARGKICPGDKKKAQVRNVILPRARQIAAAWTAKPDPKPTPPPTPPKVSAPIGVLDMVLLAHEAGKDTFWMSPNGGVSRYPVRSMDHVRSIVNVGCVDAVTGAKLTGSNWHTASVLPVAGLNDRLGQVG